MNGTMTRSSEVQRQGIMSLKISLPCYTVCKY